MVRVLDDNVTATLFPGRQVNLLQYHLGRSASVCQPAAPRRNWVRSRSGCRVSAAWPAWPRHEPTIIKRCQNIAPLRCQNISEIKNTSVRRDGWHTPRISQMMPLFAGPLLHRRHWSRGHSGCWERRHHLSTFTTYTFRFIRGHLLWGTNVKS